jgi:hypothetical protein
MRWAVGGLLLAAALLYAGRPHGPWALVALAGLVGIAATRSWGRVPVGVALAVAGAAAVTARRSVAVAGAVLLAATGAYVAVRGPRWRGLGARYDAPAQARTDADVWDALDRGEDPTA